MQPENIPQTPPPADAPATALDLLQIGFRQTADDLDLCGKGPDAAVWREAAGRVAALLEMLADASPLGRLRACQRGVFNVLERVLGDLLLFRGGDCDATAARRLLLGFEAEVRELKTTVDEWEKLNDQRQAASE